MTGNKNAWRAPLAGLASVAMLATMGVAAGTANAADVTLKLDAQGGVVANSEYKESGDSNPRNNKFEQLYDSGHTPTRDGYAFTGWFEADGHKAVSPFQEITKDTTLYAHWVALGADEKSGVTFVDAENATDWSGVTTINGYDNPLENKGVVALAPGDQLADWMYSTKQSGGYAGVFVEWRKDGVKADFAKVAAGDTVEAYATKKVDTYTLSSSAPSNERWSTGAKDVNSVKVPAGSDAPTVYYTDHNGAQKVTEWENGRPKGDAADVYMVKAMAYDSDSKAEISDAYQDSVKYIEKVSLGDAKFPVSELKGFETIKGYTFDEWYTASTLKGRLEFAKASDVFDASRTATVHGKFTADAETKTVEVTFDEHYTGGKTTTVILPQNAFIGDNLPAAPTREGYTFKGWYNGVVSTVDKDTKVSALLSGENDSKAIVYAKWLSTVYNDLYDLLNLDEDNYTEVSWKKYQAVLDEVMETAGLTDTEYDDVKTLSEAEAKEYVETLSAAKKGLEVKPGSLYAYSDVNLLTPHATDIWSLTRKGVVKGYPDGTFRPMDGLNRQDFAAYLYRLAGEPSFDAAKAENPFADVNENTPHYTEILWAADKGIVKGYEENGKTLFKGMALINRQDAAAMLYRLAGSPTIDGTASVFTDVDESTPHYAEVLWAADKGIVRGYADGTFNGYSTIVRQDAAAFLNRAYVADYLK